MTGSDRSASAAHSVLSGQSGEIHKRDVDADRNPASHDKSQPIQIRRAICFGFAELRA